MEIKIIETLKEKISVIIQCKEIDNEVIRLKTYIERFDQKLHAKKDNQYYFINSSDVLYFESVDNHTFLYTQDDVMEIKQRLYELEEILSDKDFIRISKSIIVNINKIKSLKPEINRTILVTMCNGEFLHISRKYVQSVRKLLLMKETKNEK